MLSVVLAKLWCLIGIIVGVMVFFLLIVGLAAMVTEAVKNGRK